MPSHNSKYSEDMREQTARYVLKSGKSATCVAEKKGIVYSPSKETKDVNELMKRVKQLENNGVRRKSETRVYIHPLA